jgi:hypothetical protein
MFSILILKNIMSYALAHLSWQQRIAKEAKQTAL